MKARPHLRLRLWLATLACGVVLACNTPSVPLPPPFLGALTFQPGPETGKVVLHGNANAQHADARFNVFNTSNGEGVIVTAAHDGSFTTEPFAGADGDLIDLYYDTPGQEHSQDACVQLVVNSPLLSVRCP
jgi:hypothetical protein